MKPISSPRPLAGAALGLILSLATPVLLAAQQPRPQGAWRLEVVHTDSVVPTMREGESPMPPPPGERPGDPDHGPPGAAGPGGGVGGQRFGRGRYGGAPSEKDLARLRQTMDLGRHAASRVVIDAEHKNFTVVDADGGEQSYPIGGKTVTETVEGSGEVRTKVRWKGDALQVERKVAGGGQVKESYGLGLDGTRMIVFVEVQVGMMQRSYTRRYLPGSE